VVLTGYNTDIDYAGTVYHVQTEDKGRSNPFVESLVYASGRSSTRGGPLSRPRRAGVEPQAVAAIMERQHRSIVEAIGAGRLHQLMSRDEEVASEDDTTIARPRLDAAPVSETPRPGDRGLPASAAGPRPSGAAGGPGARLLLRGASADRDRRGGLADQRADEGRRGLGALQVDAEPHRLVLAEGVTGADGRFSDEVVLPAYNGGTSAVVVSPSPSWGRRRSSTWFIAEEG